MRIDFSDDQNYSERMLRMLKILKLQVFNEVLDFPDDVNLQILHLQDDNEVTVLF